MHLNREAEVAIHGQAADIGFTLKLQYGEWTLCVEANDYNVLDSMRKGTVIKDTTTLRPEQAGAVMHLFINPPNSRVLEQELYDIIGTVFEKTPLICRIIP